MNIEKALISESHSYMFSAKARALIEEEISKGCKPDLSLEPVALEPFYQPILSRKEITEQNITNHSTSEDPPLKENLTRLKVWLSPEQTFDWNRSELFLKQLQSVSHRIGFEIIGNEKEITISILCCHNDLPIILAAFQGEFERCQLSYIENDSLNSIELQEWDNTIFYDYYPLPPYSHLLTQPDELHISPYEPLITALKEISEPAIGIYQVLFQPVSMSHNWHRNVQVLLDLEYVINLMAGLPFPQRYAQQTPSGDLHQMAGKTITKAHNDKPFYAMALRIGIICKDKNLKNYLSSISTISNLFQHGGRPLQHLTEKEYISFLSPKQIRDMFILGLTYRPGFIVNSWELTGGVHIPPAIILKYRQIPLETLETLPVRDKSLLTGTPIGECNYAGRTVTVCIPPRLRGRHTHLIGRPDMGKSTTMEHMILDDIKKDFGVAVIDPHGDLIERLLCLLNKKYIRKTIYLNLGDKEWVPIWNLLHTTPGQDLGRTADDLVGAIKSVVMGWGDRLEHLLRHSIYALLQIPHATLLDVSNLLSPNSDESKKLREEILKVIDSETARQFWQHDFKQYRKEDLGPPQHKLSKLLTSGTVSLMLSQPDNLINFRQIMDEGMILLVNLSSIGSETRDILGCFILSLLHLTAISRSDTPFERRKPFHIYCDEAHRFMTPALEDLIGETRKFRVSLTLAHQYLSQFTQKKTDALSSVGTTIIFNVDTKDAQYLKKDLQGLANVEDLITLNIGEAIARIGTEVVRIKTLEPLQIPKKNLREQIINESHRRYYKTVSEVRKAVRLRNNRWHQPFAPLTPIPEDQNGNSTIEEFYYDEF